jgi:ankyrin repeat protein
MSTRFVIAATGLLALGASFAVAANGAQSLADLARDGNREAVLAAITSPDIDVNAAGPDGSTALLWATYKVDHELVRALLKKGAKVNIINDYGSSPLSEAAKLGDVDLTRTLLAAHADPNSPNQDGQTALMLAASVGAQQVAQLLIARGANVNAVENYRGQTALMWAAAEDHPQVVELLLAHGAEVGRRARSDDWPRQMTSEPRAQFRPTGGLTALLYATRSGCLHCAVALVKAGADVNQPNPDGITPLINAIDARSFDIAMFLLDKGANPGTWDMYGRTPLYCAIDLNSWRPRAAGGPGGFAGYPGATALHAPNKATAMQIAERLLAMGVDPNHELTRMRPNGNGRGRFEDYMMRGGTGPLMVATLSFDEIAIRALLAHGAEVDEPNDFAITPLMAASGMHGSVHTTLDPPQREDIQEAAVRTIDLLLAGGANLNARVAGGRTHTAKMTAYIQGRDHEGQTALFAAAESGWEQVTRHLVERGADPTLRDADGKTALDYARSPRPAGTGVVWADPARAAAARAATVAYLESLAPKRPPSSETAMTQAGGLH